MWEPQGLYSKFILKQPTILHGIGAVRGLKNFPTAKIVVIYGSGFSKEQMGMLSKCVSSFDLKFIRKDWNGEPDLDSLKATILKLEHFKPDLIIAIGGGSVIDGAKIARLYYEFPFFDINTSRFNLLEWKTKFVVIPTTLGSGAEVSSSAVTINREEKRKEMIVTHSFIPDIVILDPSFIENSPISIVLSSCIDAIAHIVEGYVSIFDNSIAEMYAEKGLQEIINVLSFERDKYSLEDLLRLQFGGYLGGIVQNHCVVGAAHAIAHQFATYGYSHAEAVARVLPAVIKLNAAHSDVIKKKYDVLANRVGLRDLSDLLDAIEKIKEPLELKVKDLEFKSLIGKLIEDKNFYSNVQKDKGGKGNSIPLTESYIRLILTELIA